MTTPRRPDPARGLFETLLVVDGRPVELDAHMDRIGASLEALYDADLPADAAGLVRREAAGLALGRLRLTVRPEGGGFACDAVAAGVDPAIVFPGWDRGAELRSLPLAGGLGPHKLVDRPALPDATGTTVPLLIDSGGEVLEAGRANVFAVCEGVLVTPAADGRILPGIVRAATIEIARQEEIGLEERPLWREELLGADEVFLSGSVRGIEPARSLDGAPLSSGELGELIGAGLRRRYGTSRTAPAEASRSA